MYRNEFCTRYIFKTLNTGFSKADRFSKKEYVSVTKGPGQYETAKSTLTRKDISFGKSTRPEINGKPAEGPGAKYEVSGKNHKMDPTLSTATCNFACRVGWFYDNPEATKKPGPGTLVHI